MSKLMLRENNNMMNFENYIPVPYQGGIRYYREDLFDDFPENSFQALLNNAEPYETLGEDHRARFRRRQRREDRRAERRQRKSDRRQDRRDRRQDRRDSRTERIETRQAGRTERQSNRADIVKDLGTTVGGLIDGDMTGANLQFGGGQGVSLDGNIGIGSQANFITSDSLIQGIPNYILLGGAGLGIYLLTRKK